MDMSGEKLIAAPREKVWEALHDPELLKTCIPGCESIEKLTDTEVKAVAAVTLGPIAARFTGTLQLSDLDPPNGYTISGEGQGGVAGSATGGAKIALSEAAGGTILAYTLNAEIGGKLAQLDPGMVESSAQSMAEQFLTKFAAALAPSAAALQPPVQVPAPFGDPVAAGAAPYHGLAEDHDHDPSNPHYFGLPVGVIIPMVIATISVALVLYKFVF